MCTYCGVDDGHPRTQCPTRQEREIGTDRKLDAPLETCPDCGTANNRSVNTVSCWKCGHEFADRELCCDGGTVEDWHGTEAPASVDGVDLLDADACPACESTGTFFEGPAGYFTCDRCHSTWAGDAADAEIVTYLEWSEDKELVTDGGTDRWDAPICERTDLYNRARQQWSDDAQLAKLSEEAAELSAAASRALNGQADPDAFLKELVDARLMIEQFAYCYSPDRIGPVVGDTIDDLEHRLDRFGDEREVTPDDNQPSSSVELIHCGGCERHSLLEDAKAVAQRDEIDIDEPHCPRCGTRVEYEETTVEMFVPRSLDSDTETSEEAHQ